MINKELGIQNGEGKGRCEGCCFLWCCTTWTWDEDDNPLDINGNIIEMCKFE